MHHTMDEKCFKNPHTLFNSTLANGMTHEKYTRMHHTYIIVRYDVFFDKFNMLNFNFTLNRDKFVAYSMLC